MVLSGYFIADTIYCSIELNYKSEIIFETESKNFGILKQGEQVEIDYKFKNNGNEPLIIYDIQTGCGCSIAKWPDKPVKSGEMETIIVKFNTTGKKGLQKKY